MLLRRVMEHVRTQNWTAVFLDFFIVIIGVYIGIQVANWNEANKNSKKELGYLHSLYEDMIKTTARQQRMDKWYNTREAADSLILTALKTGSLSASEEQVFEEGLYRLVHRDPLYSVWDTIRELRSSGQVQIIKDNELLIEIRKMEEMYERNAKIIDGLLERNNSLYTLIADKYYVESNSDMAVRVEYNFQALAANKAFVNIVSNIIANNQLILVFRNDYRDDYARLTDYFKSHICEKYILEGIIEQQISC